MRMRSVLAGFLAPVAALTLIPLGCGGAQGDYVVVSRPSAQRLMPARPEAPVPKETVSKLKACLERREGPWPESSYAVQYDAKANDHGVMLEVKVRDTTLHDAEVEACLRQAIATMDVPKEALTFRATRPVSGGERMMREQRGLLGSSDSENPLVLLGPVIVEAVGTQAIIEIGLMIVAAVATIVDPPEQTPEEKCIDRYVDCQMTDMGRKRGHLKGHSRCQWCFIACKNAKGVWPSRAQGAVSTVSCEYWRRGK
jgi:hypothetical protein